MSAPFSEAAAEMARTFCRIHQDRARTLMIRACYNACELERMCAVELERLR